MTKNILIIDREAAASRSFASQLSEAGFSVWIHDGYERSFLTNFLNSRQLDLVVLCCKGIENEELNFIRDLLEEDCLLIICSPIFPRDVSRTVLLANPYVFEEELLEPDETVELVEEALLGVYRKASLRESHRLGSGLGSVQLYVSNIREILKSNDIVNTKLDQELTKVVDDVRTVLNRSKGIQKLATKRTGRELRENLLIAGTDLLERIRWVLPTPPANVKLIIELDEDLAKVNVIVGQIMDILRNLVENAIEAIADQAGAITIKAFNAYPHLQIEVADTGSGIPAEHQPKIFNMFFSTKESPGFGLWEARKAARKNRGTLTFTSQPGRGSTFVLTLPMASERLDQSKRAQL